VLWCSTLLWCLTFAERGANVDLFQTYPWLSPSCSFVSFADKIASLLEFPTDARFPCTVNREAYHRMCPGSCDT
jgi:hypothetical protein